MVKVITQETFDAVVKENVEEFGMDTAEAVKDAKEQFEKQGINLGNIVISEKGSQVVVTAVQDLFKQLSPPDIISRLKIIQDCCKEDLAARVLATNNGAYSVLVRIIKDTDDNDVKLEIVQTLVTVMNTNPDMLEAQGIDAINSILSSNTDNELGLVTLRLVLTCCTKCEENRVSLIQSGLLANIRQCAGSAEHVSMVCRSVSDTHSVS